MALRLVPKVLYPVDMVSTLGKQFSQYSEYSGDTIPIYYCKKQRGGHL
jgi:hypothetical protein